MSLFENLSADNIAYIGCGLALMFCLAILAVTPNVWERFKRDPSQSRSRSRLFSRGKQVTTH